MTDSTTTIHIQIEPMTNDDSTTINEDDENTNKTNHDTTNYAAPAVPTVATTNSSTNNTNTPTTSDLKQIQKECVAMMKLLTKLEQEELDLRAQNEILARTALMCGFAPALLEPPAAKRRRKSTTTSGTTSGTTTATIKFENKRKKSTKTKNTTKKVPSVEEPKQSDSLLLSEDQIKTEP